MAIHIQDLKRSHDFLDILFSNINSALFIIDDQLRVQEFNNSFIDMFGIIRDEVVGHLCGNVLGCVYTDQNEEQCGSTAYCNTCTLRTAVINALTLKESASELLIERNFHIRGAYIKKYFQFACKPLCFEGQELALLIVDDVTEKEMRNQDMRMQNQIIRKYNNKFKEELVLAQKIQKDLIPSQLPEMETIRFAVKYASMEEIGGDLYDVFKINDNLLGFFLCDVSGHGIPAALITVMMKVIVEESASLRSAPCAMVKHINEKLIDIFSDVYVTLFYGVYDLIEKKLTYVRAGHPGPLLIRDGAYMSLVDHSNFLLGFDRDFQFEESTVSLKSGDRILIFTDGVFEARNGDGLMFEERLYESLVQQTHEDVDQCVEHIYLELKNFVGDGQFDDDVCIVGMQVSDRYLDK